MMIDHSVLLKRQANAIHLANLELNISHGQSIELAVVLRTEAG